LKRALFQAYKKKMAQDDSQWRFTVNEGEFLNYANEYWFLKDFSPCS
jgi:hypothetical protein